jgi:hypothetical protein
MLRFIIIIFLNYKSLFALKHWLQCFKNVCEYFLFIKFNVIFIHKFSWYIMDAII